MKAGKDHTSRSHAQQLMKNIANLLCLFLMRINSIQFASADSYELCFFSFLVLPKNNCFFAFELSLLLLNCFAFEFGESLRHCWALRRK